MKFLHVMPYSPVPADYGGAIRVFHILKNIARYHDVTVLTFGNEEDYCRMRQAFNSGVKAIHLIPRDWTKQFRRVVQLYSHWTGHSFFHYEVRSKRMQAILDDLLERNDFDIVQIEFAHMGVFTVNSDAIKILDAHNVEYDNFRRIWLNARSAIQKFHYHREYKKFFREEIDACQRQDAIFVTSMRDKNILDAHVPDTPKFIVPNGVDANYFSPSDVEPEPHSLVFTGLMAYIPNYDGMFHFLDNIFPLILQKVPDAKIYIVGNRPPKELVARASHNVIVSGYVEDVRPYIERASVYVVPLRMGGGTRLKVVEAMAMKKPIVSTSIGSEGINVRHRESALLEDDAQAFADAVVELLHDRDLQRHLVQNGYELMRTSYEWSVIGQQQEEHYRELLQSRKWNGKLRAAIQHVQPVKPGTIL
jgi:glycosyltransferase involved in cell wall biosynthesis